VSRTRSEQQYGSARFAEREHSSDWGCVALLVNPSRDVSRQIIEEWAARVSRERDRQGRPTYDAEPYTVKGQSAIDDRGLLQIPWPTVENGESLQNFDLLLATATRPDSATGDYPTVEAIAEAWNRKGDAEYFRMNRKFGIRTFQDEAIDALLTV
jgi:hypothetical protein